MQKKKTKSSMGQLPLLVDTTETEAGLDWLNSLPEDQFRDKVLVEVFRRMQAEGLLESFENIHGRNDKGVDYLVASASVFTPCIRGIQIKSKRITRSESANGLSAVRIREECQAAMLHEFHFQGRAVRLDTIDLWCSAPITEDAEKELNPPHGHVRIGLKKDREILSLIEKFCPLMLGKVPQFAIAKYIADSRNPGPKAVRILGCNLNPSLHFIEPFFSSAPPSSTRQLKQKNGSLQSKREKIALEQIVADTRHTVIFAPPLSGRTYLLEHLKCRFAVAGRISLILHAEEIPKGEFKIENFIAQRLGFASSKQVKQLQESTGILLLVDDVDKASPETQNRLFANEARFVRVVATARSIVAPASVNTVHLIGVDWNCIVRFLRAVDNKLAAGKPFVDRARLFLERAFDSSGLPKNPFTIAVMLEECQHSYGKFSTPTMGRLIGRFIELQLGSHSDTSYVVDFETKREFLTRLAAHAHSRFSIQEFEKLLGRFIGSKGHPHSITDFSNDLLRSGVFERTADSIAWSHPVIKEFFWVKNLVAKRTLAPIQKKLEAAFDTTLAALAGSQLADARPLLETLLPRLAKVTLPSFDEVISSPDLAVPLSKLISDKDEEDLLADLETDSLLKGHAEERPPGAPVEKGNTGRDVSTSQLSADQKSALKKRLEPAIKNLAESELHIAFNVAALVLNARDTDRDHKEQSVEAVISSCKLIAHFTKEIVSAVYANPKKIEFLSSWLRVAVLCGLADEMLGDPHLVSIFRGCMKKTGDQNRTLALLDLLLCCGEDENARILQELKKANHLGVTMAFYFRVAMLYFFRFHRDNDRSSLRKLLTDIRKMERQVDLPKLV